MEDKKPKNSGVRHIRHMSMNISGLLRNYGRKKMDGIFTDDNGNEYSDKTARKYLAECQAKGWKLLPMSDECEGFDHFGDGCPGHEIIEETEKNDPPKD